MRSITEFDGVFLYRDSVDMRKWIDGLAAIVQSEMNLDPCARYLFGFINRSRDKVKLLYFDRTGFAVWYKRLEREVFTWPAASSVSITLSHQQLAWLLDGYDLSKMKPHGSLSFSAMS